MVIIFNVELLEILNFFRVFIKMEWFVFVMVIIIIVLFVLVVIKFVFVILINEGVL